MSLCGAGAAQMRITTVEKAISVATFVSNCCAY